MGNFIDLTGQKFGRLTVIKRVENDKHGNSQWLCKCDCGNEKIIDSHSLKSGNTKSCGCLLKESAKKQGYSNLIDLTGQKFERLTVIKRVEDYVSPKGKKNTQWLCKCDCGNETTVRTYCLTGGITKSCGCLNRELLSKQLKKYNTYDLSGEYGVGYTSKGEEFYFDLEDYDKIKDSCWCINQDGYVTCSDKTSIHRIVTNCPKGMVVDHVNGKETRNDNRKSNLRVCTQHENAMNCNIPTNNSSGYKGVSWDKTYKKWNAYITINYKKINLGYFENINDAIKIRKEAEEKYFGEFAYKAGDLT